MRSREDIVLRRKGFTLVESVVVMAALSLLAAMVSGGVVGVKSRGEEVQVQRDAYAVQLTVQRFATDFGSGLLPAALINFDGSNYLFQGMAVPRSMVGFLANNGAYALNYREIDWAARVPVKQSNGDVVNLSYVPDFLSFKPDSTRLTRGGYKEYLWLLKVGTPTRVEVWRLNEGASAYERVYPQG